MIDYVYGHDDAVAKFVSSMIPELRSRGFGKCRALGMIDEDGRLVAGMVYHNYDPESGVIEMSGAAIPGQQWLTRETLKRMYTYPFLQLGCQLVLMRVAADNQRLLRQLQALNYAFIRIPRLLGRDRDAVLCLLTREDWEAGKFCKRLKHHLEDRPSLHKKLEAA